MEDQKKDTKSLRIGLSSPKSTKYAPVFAVVTIVGVLLYLLLVSQSINVSTAGVVLSCHGDQIRILVTLDSHVGREIEPGQVGAISINSFGYIASKRFGIISASKGIAAFPSASNIYELVLNLDSECETSPGSVVGLDLKIKSLPTISRWFD